MKHMSLLVLCLAFVVGSWWKWDGVWLMLVTDWRIESLLYDCHCVNSYNGVLFVAASASK